MSTPLPSSGSIDWYAWAQQTDSLARNALAASSAYTNEQAQDAAASLLTSGTHSGISFTYDDTGNKVNATVTGGGTVTLPWVNIKDFGALVDGFTDDTTAIRNAIASFNTSGTSNPGTGGVVYFPGGVTRISGTLDLPSNVHLRGAGMSASVIKLQPNSNCHMITTHRSTGAGNSNAFWSSVTELMLDGRKLNQGAVLTTVTMRPGYTTLTTSSGVFAANGTIITGYGLLNETTIVSGGGTNTVVISQAPTSSALQQPPGQGLVFQGGTTNLAGDPIPWCGIYHETNPYNSSQTSADNQFDPTHRFENLRIYYIQGDGVRIQGRSDITCRSIKVSFATGNGFTVDFDSVVAECMTEFVNGHGLELPGHSSNRVIGNKFYNSYGAGIYAHGGSNGELTMVGNDLQQNCWDGLRLESQSGVQFAGTISQSGYANEGGRDPHITTWAPSETYGNFYGSTTADYAVPTVANGRLYGTYVAGTSATTEPTWPTTVGATVVDGTVTWVCLAGAPTAVGLLDTSNCVVDATTGRDLNGLRITGSSTKNSVRLSHASTLSGAQDVSSDSLALSGTNNHVISNGVNLTDIGGGGGSYTDEQAQDAAASLFTTGTHSGISFTYNDAANKVNATVTGGGSSDPATAPGSFGSTPREVYDAVVTSGSATVTSATASFVSGDVGKAIRGNNIPFGATISAVGSSTSATMSVTATGSNSANPTTIGDLTLASVPGVRYPRSPAGHLFAVIGDSIAPQLATPGANYGGAFGSSGAQDSLSFAHLLSDGQILQGQRAGIGSQRIEMMIPRLYQDVIPYAPHFCMIQTGTNDVSFGHSPSTWAGYITTMCNILLTAGITPVLATAPPVPSAYRAQVDQYRKFVTAYAARNGFPLVDAYGALRNPDGSGGYNPTLDSGDGVHPNVAGYQAYGQAIVDGLAAFMAPGKPPLQAVNDATVGASSASLVYNGLFLNDSNSDGIPDGWEKSGTSTTSTCSIVTGDSAITGNALRLHDTGTGSTFIETSNVMGAVPNGHRWACSGRVKVVGDSNCRLVTYVQSKYPGEPVILNWSGLTNATNGWKRFYVEGVNDTGASRLAELELSSSTGGSNVDIYLAQVGFYDLTAAGLA